MSPVAHSIKAGCCCKATGNPAVAGFIKAIRETKQLLLESDDEWQRLADSGAIKDGPDALADLRDRFREGIPQRELNDEIQDAEVVYQLLEKPGGKKLVTRLPSMYHLPILSNHQHDVASSFRSSTRRILPEIVFGSEPTKRMMRGYL